MGYRLKTMEEFGYSPEEVNHIGEMWVYLQMGQPLIFKKSIRENKADPYYWSKFYFGFSNFHYYHPITGEEANVIQVPNLKDMEVFMFWENDFNLDNPAYMKMATAYLIEKDKINSKKIATNENSIGTIQKAIDTLKDKINGTK